MDILDSYNTLRESQHGTLKLPKMQRGTWHSDSHRIENHDRLWDTLKSHSPTKGWLLFQSLQFSFDQKLPKRDDQWGLLLAAEAMTSAGDSLSIGRDGANGWILACCRHDPEGDDLWDEVQQYPHDPGANQLCYRRYWRFNQEQGYVQERTCFIGFK